MGQGLALKYIRTNGADDYAKVRELVRILRGVTIGKLGDESELNGQLALIDGELWSGSSDLVGSNSTVINNIALAFARKVENSKRLPENFFSESELESVLGVCVLGDR